MEQVAVSSGHRPKQWAMCPMDGSVCRKKRRFMRFTFPFFFFFFFLGGKTLIEEIPVSEDVSQNAFKVIESLFRFFVHELEDVSLFERS